MSLRNATLAYIVSAVQATLVLVVAFGLSLSDKQIAAVVAAVSAWGIVAVAINDRRRHR
ncbi:MAG: hypothetical protein HY323_05580 [Betaproteobacteria bacterium]|nr:hypothetical protein [Betaproteobacteria bacterium]